MSKDLSSESEKLIRDLLNDDDLLIPVIRKKISDLKEQINRYERLLKSKGDCFLRSLKIYF